jgi:hypothetical protein
MMDGSIFQLLALGRRRRGTPIEWHQCTAYIPCHDVGAQWLVVSLCIDPHQHHAKTNFSKKDEMINNTLFGGEVEVGSRFFWKVDPTRELPI